MKCAQKAGKIYQYNLKLKISNVNFHQSDESDQITRQIDVLFEKYGMQKYPKLSQKEC